MKGAISVGRGFGYTYMPEVFETAGDIQKDYNWLITDAWVASSDEQLQQFINIHQNSHTWMTGDEMAELSADGVSQWLFAVLSGFPKHVTKEQVLEHELPFADGYNGFFENPVKIQHPLAEIEIVPYDSSLVLLISRDDSIVERFISNMPFAEDLEAYNEKKEKSSVIRAMRHSDVPRVAEIHVFGWRSAYRGIVPDDYLFNNMLVPKRIEAFYVLLSGSGENYVFDDGIIKAFLTVGKCRDEDKPEAFELCGLYVEPLMKRQGIGAIMAGHCEKRAADRGFREICLWVLEKNAASRAFYEKMGYLPDGARKFLEHINADEIRYSKIF